MLSHVHIGICEERMPSRVAGACCNSSSNDLASFRSSVSKPSVNHPQTGARRSWASLCRPCSAHRRARSQADRDKPPNRTTYQGVVVLEGGHPRRKKSTRPHPRDARYRLVSKTKATFLRCWAIWRTSSTPAG